MPYKKYPLLKKKNLKTISIKERKSLVDIKNFTTPYLPGSDFNAFINSLPDFLAAKEIREFIKEELAGLKGKNLSLGSGCYPYVDRSVFVRNKWGG